MSITNFVRDLSERTELDSPDSEFFGIAQEEVPDTLNEEDGEDEVSTKGLCFTYYKGGFVH